MLLGGSSSASSATRSRLQILFGSITRHCSQRSRTVRQDLTTYKVLRFVADRLAGELGAGVTLVWDPPARLRGYGR
jgi:hypothetical protein